MDVKGYMQASAMSPDGRKFAIVPYLWLDTVGNNLQDRFKRVATGLMEEIEHIKEEQRFDFVIQRIQAQRCHALFEHNLPTEEQKQQMRIRSQMTGDKQPKGGLNLAEYEANGSYGTFISEVKEILNNPLSEEERMRNWMLAKVAVKMAMRAVSRM